MDVASLIVESSSKPVQVNLVKVEGVVHTSYDFLDFIVRDLLSARSVGELVVGSRNVGSQLRRLGLFKDVGVSINATPGKENSVDVVYKVVESPRVYAKQGATFGQQDAKMDLALNIRNLFGNAEALSIKSSYGVANDTTLSEKLTKKSEIDGLTSYELSLTKPLFASPDDTLELTAYKSNSSQHTTIQCHETDHGFSLARICLLGIGEYKLSYNAIWRENHSFDSTASIYARKEGGHSLKSSVYHQFYMDTRKDKVFPQDGVYFKFFQELAGLGGDVQFLKNEFDTQFVYDLKNEMSIAIALRGGIIVPLSESLGFKPRSNDRFYLGGPLSLRGFTYAGVGPRVGGNSLGGNAFNALGIDFMFPLPLLSKSFFRGHLFINGGSLVPLETKNFLKSKIDFLTNHSIAIGVGLVARFTSFRLELNYCIPVRATVTDSLKPGFQLGIGIHFM